MGYGVRLARASGRPEPALHAFRRAGDARPARELVARGMPGCAVLAPSAPSRLLGVRRPAARRDARRQLERRRRPDDRLQAPLPGSLPDPPHAADHGLRLERRALAGGRQHRRLQLPLRGRARPAPLVGARVRPGDRRQPGREPVSGERARSPARGEGVPRPLERQAGDGRARRAARARVRDRSAGSGAAAGPGRPTTSTFPRPAVSAPRRTPDGWRAAPRGRSSASASGRFRPRRRGSRRLRAAPARDGA